MDIRHRAWAAGGADVDRADSREAGQADNIDGLVVGEHIDRGRVDSVIAGRDKEPGTRAGAVDVDGIGSCLAGHTGADAVGRVIHVDDVAALAGVEVQGAAPRPP